MNELTFIIVEEKIANLFLVFVDFPFVHEFGNGVKIFSMLKIK
jgi:hypothetical protein